MPEHISNLMSMENQFASEKCTSWRTALTYFTWLAHYLTTTVATQ